MEFFNFIKATQKSGQPDAVIWFTAKTEARASLMLDVALEDAGIETGRGKNYQKPVRTDFPVYDGLPEENTIDFTWCERYDLADDQRTWKLKLKAELSSEDAAGFEDVETAPPETSELLDQSVNLDEANTLHSLAAMPFRTQLLAQFASEETHVFHINKETQSALVGMEMDTNNSYVQNLLLAASNVPELKKYDMNGLWKLTRAIKEVFPQDLRHELGLIIRFMKLWVVTNHIDRGILTREWAAGNRINEIQRTNAGTNADSGLVTDRDAGTHHTFDILDLEIACALLPMDFNHLEIPGTILRRAKEIVSNKEEPWKSWSKILRNQPGVLAVNRAAIFNLVRIAPENIHLTPVAHLEFVNQTMTAEFNAATELMPLSAIGEGSEKKEFESQQVGELIAAAREESAPDIIDPANTSQPKVENLGGGMFSIDGLVNETSPASDDSLLQAVAEAGDQTEESGNEVMNNIPTLTPVKTSDVTAAINEAGHHNAEAKTERLYSHLMLDLETMGKKPGAPVVSMGAVFFDPATGETGKDFYQVISLESSMSFGANPDAGTILWWLKQSSETRSAILIEEALGLVEALEKFTAFIDESAANGPENVQLWGKGSSFDCSIIEAAFELADTPFPIPFWNHRDVRTVVELGKAVGINSRYEIPFEGDQHTALADAHHQVKYVSAIWQRLTTN